MRSGSMPAAFILWKTSQARSIWPALSHAEISAEYVIVLGLHCWLSSASIFSKQSKASSHFPDPPRAEISAEYMYVFFAMFRSADVSKTSCAFSAIFSLPHRLISAVNAGARGTKLDLVMSSFILPSPASARRMASFRLSMSHGKPGVAPGCFAASRFFEKLELRLDEALWWCPPPRWWWCRLPAGRTSGFLPEDTGPGPALGRGWWCCIPLHALATLEIVSVLLLPAVPSPSVFGIAAEEALVPASASTAVPVSSSSRLPRSTAPPGPSGRLSFTLSVIVPSSTASGSLASLRSRPSLTALLSISVHSQCETWLLYTVDLNVKNIRAPTSFGTRAGAG
mmetsp:Transcript_9989/g.34482  ORF Transcript_9989/g.34482 Transcript_9989/m.34482 type:complete len:339 (-) Transcript_9989:176-1192(-)